MNKDGKHQIQTLLREDIFHNFEDVSTADKLKCIVILSAAKQILNKVPWIIKLW